MSGFRLPVFVSPWGERSFLKNVPMEYRDHPTIQTLVKQGARIRYRGPRVRAGRTDKRNAQYDCRKRHAVTFSLYLPS